MNLDEFELAGLKLLQKRVSKGEIIILPIDKSGWFAVMTVDTYIKAGMVHVEGDEDISLDDLKSNQMIWTYNHQSNPQGHCLPIWDLFTLLTHSSAILGP